MDLICVTCGEPWGLDQVVHEEPRSFERTGCAVTRCPCCKERVPKLTNDEKRRLSALAEVAADHGDDLDGFASFLDDFGDRLGDDL
jgi:hypothetical protein